MVFTSLVVVLLLNTVYLSSQQTAEDINANSVYVQFDKGDELLEMDEWEENGATAKFKDITASVASNYCGNSTEALEACNLVDLTSNFGSGDVMLDGEEEFFNGDIRLKVYISLTGKNTQDENLLLVPKDALIEILVEGKPLYDTGLTNEGVDYNITLIFVNEERVQDQEENPLNLIMIIVSILILLSACLLAVVLKCKESMEEKKQLEAVASGRSTTATTDGENVTLTTIKPKGQEDGAEGPVKV